MKVLSAIALMLAGGVVALLFFRIGFFGFVDFGPPLKVELSQKLPTYLTFVGVMLTAVTVVLAAVTIGIGVLAAFTIQELRDRLDQRVDAALDEKLTEEALGDRIANFTRKKQNPTVAELEASFDPEDTEIR